MAENKSIYDRIKPYFVENERALRIKYGINYLAINHNGDIIADDDDASNLLKKIKGETEDVLITTVDEMLKSLPAVEITGFDIRQR